MSARCVRDSLGVPQCPHELVWPAHAGTIAWGLLFLAVIVIAGWWHLRGDACLFCGREGKDCGHTIDLGEW